MSSIARPRRLDRERSLLLVIDIQERLAPAIDGVAALSARVGALVAAAAAFDIPVRATEHCADRIGPLVASLREPLPPEHLFAKRCFGACDDPAFQPWLRAAGRTQLVVAGIEAHVCVLQTTLGLAASDWDVFVVADAVGSRAGRAVDRELALGRLHDAGCVLVSTEAALFEWTAHADDERFRDVLARLKSLP